MAAVLLLERPEQLDAAAVIAVADGRLVPVLADGLSSRLGDQRTALLAALATAGPVYGVSTGMGAMSSTTLTPDQQSAHQTRLLAGRSVGSPPWLSAREVRAVLAVRLRTLLHPEVGASPQLCAALAALLAAGVHPAVPARGSGAAGEIIPLAHLGSVLLGRGRALDLAGPDAPPPGRPGPAAAVPAGAALEAAGLAPYELGAKEGAAMLQGVPVATALALLRARDARRLLAQAGVVLAASSAVARASRDPLHPALGRGDDELAAVLDRQRALRPGGPVASLQAPVSFRAAPAALVVAGRAVGALEGAAERALVGVTDSPAHVDGALVGTAGWAGTELSAAFGALATALVHAAEVGAARFHRLLDPRVTGLAAQLSAEPGAQAGVVAVHKRLVGVVHRARRFAVPSLVGAIETSLGQEDVQSFALEAAECAAEALAALRDAVACELLAVHRARLLGADVSGTSLEVAGLLAQAAACVVPGVQDHAYGEDVDALTALLEAGWAMSA